MKTLKFAPHLVDNILSGKKYATWRVNDDKDIRAGDELSLMTPDGNHFAVVVVTSVKETTLGAATPDDRMGNEGFTSDEEMYRTFSKYYGIVAGPDTKVKIIRFRLVDKAPSPGKGPVDG